MDNQETSIADLAGNTVIFMDTSFMRGTSHKDTDYLSILNFCKTNDIDVYISEINKEEWRTQKVDEFDNNLKPLKNALEKLKEKQPHLLHEIFPTPTLIIPEQAEIDKKSISIIDNFLEQHNIKIAPIRSHHAEKTWKAYFQGDEPFKRIKARNDIPDAWVCQAAVDIKEENTNKKNFFILCRKDNQEDKKLTESLEGIGYKPKDYQEFARKIASQESKKEEAITVLSNNELDNTPASIANSSDHNELHQRVLATVYLLSADAPVSEVNLIEFLKEFYTPDKIIATADYLAAVQDVLKKIGDGYVPRDKHLCKEAYDNRLPEILRIMSKGQ
jgi:hypothetical protein